MGSAVASAASLLLVVTAVLAAPPLEVLVYFENPDGWLILARDGQQIARSFTVLAFAREPGALTVEILFNGEVVRRVSEPVEFRFERTFTAPGEAGSLDVRVTLEYEGGRYTVTRSFSVAPEPRPVPPGAVVMGPKQFERLLARVKSETALAAGAFAVLGVLAAVVLRYHFKLLDFANALQVPANGIVAAVAYAYDEELFPLLFGVSVLANLVAYHAVRGPAVVAFLSFDPRRRNVTDAVLPVYRAPDGRLAVALQSARAAIERALLGRHVYLRLKGPSAERFTYWTRNGTTPLLLVRGSRLLRDEELEGARVLEVELMDAHDVAYVRHVSAFSRVKSLAQRALEELAEAREAMGVERALAKAEALAELDELIRTKVEGGKRG